MTDLISHDASLDVTSVSINQTENIVEEVIRQAPNVMILDDQGCRNVGDGLVSILQQFPNIKIVILSSNSNQGEVYSKFQFDIKQVADFFDIL